MHRPNGTMSPLASQVQIRHNWIMDPVEFNAPEESPNLKTYLIEFIQTLVICMVVGLVVYWQVAQPHKVSGSSMFPTFHSGDYIITNKIYYKFKQPKRGDVVVLKNPKNDSEDFIKRIIGLPGEKVKVEDGHVYINEELLDEPYLDKELLTPPGSYLREGVDVTVDPDNYIVIGDNRTASSDSREWGLVPEYDIIGQVFFRYWPQNAFGLIPTTVEYK